jgi:hypothetical protein
MATTDWRIIDKNIKATIEDDDSIPLQQSYSPYTTWRTVVSSLATKVLSKINSQPSESVINDTDSFPLQDAGGNVKRSIGSTIYAYVLGKINGLTTQTTINDTDSFPLQDDGGNVKRSVGSTLYAYVLGKINGLTTQTTINDTDSFPLQDDGGNVKRSVGSTLYAYVLGKINGLTTQTTINDTDSFPLQDSSNVIKHTLASTLYTYIKTKLLVDSGLLLAMHPIGESYTQHYGDPLPSTLYGGTWTIRFNTEAIVEMTESSGGATWEEETFDATVKDSQMQGHIDKLTLASASTNGSFAGLWYGNNNGGVQDLNGSGPISDGVNGTPRIGLSTKPRRRIVRKFTRTA